jgi:hypothetical protein
MFLFHHQLLEHQNRLLRPHLHLQYLRLLLAHRNLGLDTILEESSSDILPVRVELAFLISQYEGVSDSRFSNHIFVNVPLLMALIQILRYVWRGLKVLMIFMEITIRRLVHYSFTYMEVLETDLDVILA